MLLKELQKIFHNELDAIYGKEEVSSFFFLCTTHYCKISRLQLALNVILSVSKDDEALFFLALKALKNEKPIQYILGETEFYGMLFKVNENTLIPRPETEELVSLVLQKTKEKKLKTVSILDIGTGSGCIAIALAKNIKKAKIYGLDVSEKALKIAKENAALNAVDVSFIEADILKICHSEFEAENNFDTIVSNPPYVRNLEKKEIKNNVLAHEPHLALFVEDNNPLVFYKAITEFAVNNLKPKGELYFEINQYLGPEMIELVERFGFANVKILNDMFGNNRILSAVKLK